MKTLLHPASERGQANHGWLKTHHSFSFADYYDAAKVHFGKLRVLNDDWIAARQGFGLHPHQNMEIITIPLAGKLRHGDNMGNESVIVPGEVQVMSAGTGVWHSEYNASETDPLELLQIWIFPDKNGYQPRYDDYKFDETAQHDRWQLLVSPDARDESLWINQQAFLSLRKVVDEKSFSYPLNHPDHGVYFFLIAGNLTVAGQQLATRDAVGVWEIPGAVPVDAEKESLLLAIEVPMK